MQEAPAVPEILAGKYRLVRRLGAGGMGTVWLADHLSLHSPVAIKLIDPEVAGDSRFRARFMHEARAAAALRSPHVVQILDYGVDGATPYIAMELLEGESLAERLQRAGRLSPQVTARLLTHVGRALSRAEEAGIVHRDLKPANIFLVHNDEEELAKVLDFGIAKHTAPASGAGGDGADRPLTTESGALLGTRSYMSPEQAGGARDVDSRADVWALGVIAFECLLGQRAYDGETVGEFLHGLFGRPPPIPSARGAVPPGFDAWFARACAYAAADRFPSAREACAELRQVCGLAGSGETATPRSGAAAPASAGAAAGAAPTLPQSSAADLAAEAGPRPPARRRSAVTIVVSLALAAIVAVAIKAAWRAPAASAVVAPGTVAPASRPAAAPAAPTTALPPVVPPSAVAGTPPSPSPTKPARPKHATTRRPAKPHERAPAAESPPPANKSPEINLGI